MKKADIFVYLLDDVNGMGDSVMLVLGGNDPNYEEYVSSLAGAVLDKCIYFFADFSEPAEWEPSPWFRAVKTDGTLWAESSDEQEVRELAAEIGVKPQRLFERVVKDHEWREV